MMQPCSMHWGSAYETQNTGRWEGVPIQAKHKNTGRWGGEKPCLSHSQVVAQVHLARQKNAALRRAPLDPAVPCHLPPLWPEPKRARNAGRWRQRFYRAHGPWDGVSPKTHGLFHFFKVTILGLSLHKSKQLLTKRKSKQLLTKRKSKQLLTKRYQHGQGQLL